MEPLLDSWDINARQTLYLLEAISDDQLHIKLEKGKTVLSNFSHIHSVRLMWLKSGHLNCLKEYQNLKKILTAKSASWN